MTKRKPWRKFKKKKAADQHIRRICLAVFGLELLILMERGEFSFPTVEVTDDREVVIYQAPVGENPAIPEKNQIFGIRIRLKDGVVDFYRREEIHDQGQ